ncbi:MAG: amidinotransferase [Deltaproteobacteria bacterium]|nr:amidinotransferase [Deltaproteobacteria bacterium]
MSKPSAFGGRGWSPRTAAHREEIGSVWASCGVQSEWAPLRAVLLHAPGAEIAASADPGAMQWLAAADPDLARAQHDALSSAYRSAGVTVHLVDPPSVPPINLLFVADLLFMTPEGAIVGRTASTVRAGEERLAARALAILGIPILHTVRGAGVFEGADAAWLDPGAVLLATGLRTNEEGARQVEAVLRDLGVRVRRTTLPGGTMHLMGQLRFADRALAIAWSQRLDPATSPILTEHGYEILSIPSGEEAVAGYALNLVTLGPRSVLMPAGNPATQSFLEDAGIACRTVDVSELLKGAGGWPCRSSPSPATGASHAPGRSAS